MPGQPDPLSDMREPLQPCSAFEELEAWKCIPRPQLLSLLLQFWDENGCKGYTLIRVNLIFSFFYKRIDCSGFGGKIAANM